MNARAAREYSSPLRTEQAGQTRERIVQAAVDLLSEGDADDLSMNDVAARAGVSVRTVYRNFATRDDLLDGVIESAREQLESRVGPPATTRRDYEQVTPRMVEALFDMEPLYRALFATHAGRESHRRGASERRKAMAQVFAAQMRELDKQAALRFGALIHLLSSSNSVLFLKDYWGLSADDIARVLGWAIATLADAAGDPKQRKEL
jgi:AcrR family transcriptional regulator